nr:bifunctional aminoglycoside phosphotransferase/ATP-binding protein [Caldovatus aquaticus]
MLARLTGAAPIETHISAVFVGRDEAFKLKKAVALGFLDFTSLAARERFCRRELALNRRFAPGIYREVLPLTRGPDGALRLGGEAGAAVEWVVRMARIPDDAFLDRIAARGGLTPALLDALADAVAAMHEAAERVAEPDAPAAMRQVLEGNRAAALAAGLPAPRVEAWAAAAGAALQRLAPALAARAAEGRVRRCHGDLHLGNLCLWDGRPTPFDALEFDESLARIDVGYDLAFLLMDLEARAVAGAEQAEEERRGLGGRAAANRVLNRLLARTGDYGLLAPLPLWLSLRAMIRAHVEAARGGADAASYLAMAEGYLRPAAARLVAIGGLQGTGKSRLARALAPALGPAPGAVILRTDEIRKRRFGVPPEQRLPPAAYAETVSAAVHAELFATAERIARAGHAVIADAVFLDPDNRAGIEAAARAAGVPFDGFWLEAPLEILRRRIGARHHDASDATAAVLERAARTDPGPIAWRRTDASGDPLPAVRAALGLH